MKPSLIKGGMAVDDRGPLSFVNGVDFSKVKRCYMVENFSTKTIRGLHGHLKEEKYAFVVSGAAIIIVFPMKSDKTLGQGFTRFVLSAAEPQVLHIPAVYANGFRCLTEGTRILFFSTSTLEESKGDDFRFPVPDIDIWRVVNR